MLRRSLSAFYKDREAQLHIPLTTVLALQGPMKYLTEPKREKTRQIPVTTASFTSSLTKNEVAARQLLADNKSWGGGAGRVTNQMMKKLSNNYGLAIRQGSRLSSGKKYTK